MIAELHREYTFEAAHRLPHVPEGHKCRRMHGHSYAVTLIVRGRIGADGMVVDFAAIDDTVKPVVAALDHTTLNDHNGLENPTSENLAAWLIRRVREAVPLLFAVEVRETRRSMCRVLTGEVSP